MYMNIDCCTFFIHFSMSLYWAINSKLLIRCCEAISMFVYFFRLLEDLSGRDGPVLVDGHLGMGHPGYDLIGNHLASVGYNSHLWGDLHIDYIKMVHDFVH